MSLTQERHPNGEWIGNEAKANGCSHLGECEGHMELILGKIPSCAEAELFALLLMAQRQCTGSKHVGKEAGYHPEKEQGTQADDYGLQNSLDKR